MGQNIVKVSQHFESFNSGQAVCRVINIWRISIAGMCEKEQKGRL